MSTNLEYRARGRQRKREKAAGQRNSTNEKGERALEREIKNKGDIFLLGEQHENFVAVVRQ